MQPPLRLYNTLTRTKEAFAPVDPKNVRMYVCGPTVYDYAHIGNARPVIVFDVLYRLLRHLYGADHVRYARNLTDVDDKINARAARDYPDLQLNAAIAKVTEGTTAQFHADVDALGNLRPDDEPRATGHIAEMKAIIERLIARGVAYVAEEHVLFHVPAVAGLKGAPRYGSLARRSLDEMVAGARVDVAPYKRDPMDFVLWKPSRDGIDPGWPSPAGIATPGRPGWHIECSAMSMKTLLEPFGGGLQCDDPGKNVFDIHGGGIDLVFPHHENEMAQSCCAFGCADGAPLMANVWMHNGFLQVEGEKMSKSLGNFVTINELLETESFGGRKWPGEVLRLAMLKTHYRQPIDWTVKALEEASQTLVRWRAQFAGALPSEPTAEFLEGLEDDLNTPRAIAAVHALVSDKTMPGRKKAGYFAASMKMLGLDILSQEKTLYEMSFTSPLAAGERPGEFALYSPSRTVAEVRAHALSQDASALVLQEKISPFRFAASEMEFGRVLERWQKLGAINSLIAARVAARKAKNFAESDRIRDELVAMGIVLMDGKDPTTGELTTSWEVKR